MTLEQLLESELFAGARVIAMPEPGRRVSGLAVADEPDTEPGENEFALTGGFLLTQPGFDAFGWLSRLVGRGVCGLGISARRFPHGIPGELTAAAASLGLAFVLLPTKATLSGLITGFMRLEEHGGERVLQAAFFGGGVKELLTALNAATGLQAMAEIGQDIFVVPREPPLPESLFFQSDWKKRGTADGYPQVERFSSRKDKRSILRFKLVKNGYPFGKLYLLREEGEFCMYDCRLFNYAAILCCGMEGVHQIARRIGEALGAACGDGRLSPEQLGFFPKEGSAFFLRDYGKPAPGRGQQQYLAYLMKSNFSIPMCYSFLSPDTLAVYSSAPDATLFGGRLLQVLAGAGRSYSFGVSRYYAREELSVAFSEARHAAEIAYLLGREGRLCFFHELGIYRLFSYPENGWPVNQMLGDMDVMLQTMDEEKRNMLTATLRVFVKNKFSYQATAQELYTHVNTIRYRIRLLEDLWGISLSSDDGRLLFSVLAKLLPLWMKQTGYPSPPEME